MSRPRQTWKIRWVLTSSMRTASSWETEVTAWLMTLRSPAFAIRRSLWQEAQTKRFTVGSLYGSSDIRATMCHSTPEENCNWIHWIIAVFPVDSYGEELGEVELSEEKALSLLQNVSWQVTQLSLKIIHGGFFFHRQILSQHARITHQVLQLQLSSC